MTILCMLSNVYNESSMAILLVLSNVYQGCFIHEKRMYAYGSNWQKYAYGSDGCVADVRNT